MKNGPPNLFNGNSPCSQRLVDPNENPVRQSPIRYHVPPVLFFDVRQGGVPQFSLVQLALGGAGVGVSKVPVFNS